jgi:LmbE family N-acetylglucosaminyl deacetylase
MIRARLRKAQRLLELQQGLQRIEEAKIAAVRSRQAELAALQEDLVSALNADEGPQGLLVVAIVRRLKNLGEEAVRLGEELERRYDALRTHASRAKVAERRSRAYEEQHAKDVAKKELLDIIDRAIRAGNARLP